MAEAVANPHPLTEAERAALEDDGFVIIRRVVPDAALDEVRSAFAGAVDRLARQWHEEGLLADLHEELPFESRYAAIRADLPARFAVSWRRILVSEAVHGLWQVPEILGRARSVVGDEVFAHDIWNGRPREPHTAIQKIGWHQDAHYYRKWDPADGVLLSMWLPLVPVDEESGCLQFIPGSHKRGWVPFRQNPLNNLLELPPEAVGDVPPVSAVTEPGDLVLFTDTTVHQALDNRRDGYVRWSIDIRFGQPTPPIVAKSRMGYHCFSASDPGRVEPYEVWAERYRFSDDADAKLDELAGQLGVSRSEVRVF